MQREGQRFAEVVRPVTLSGALAALAENPASRPLAGGTDLLIELARSSDDAPAYAVDLTSIDGFDAVTETAESLRLGGGVTHAQVVEDPRFVTAALPLAQACLEIGSPQLRNRATIAGNLATASPANDTISALMALDASLELASIDAAGDVHTRTVALVDFFTGFRATVLGADELIAAIIVPKLDASKRGMWFKVGLRKNQAISVVHGGVVVEFDGERVVSARVALGSVAPTVVLVDEVAALLNGATLDADTIAEAAQRTARSVAPITDGRATSDYRTAVIETSIRRTLETLAAGQQAATWPVKPPTLRGGGVVAREVPHPEISDSTEISVDVNGSTLRGAGAVGATLLDWLRQQRSGVDDDRFWGTKEGCAEGECGACTVHLDGAAVMSCLVNAAQADGAQVVTIEGLAEGDALHAVQEAFVGDFAVQCGYCIPGFVVATERLLASTPAPTDEQIVQGLGGNLCRCTGYYSIVNAVHSAASALREGGNL